MLNKRIEELDSISSLYPMISMLEDALLEPRRTQVNQNKILIKGSSFPKIDVYKNKDDSFTVEAAIVGINAKDVVVSIDNNFLKFQYKKDDEVAEEGRTYLFRELTRSNFERQIALPDFLDLESAETSYSDGVLKINFKMKEERKPKILSFN